MSSKNHNKEHVNPERFYLDNFDHKKILKKFLRLNDIRLQRTKTSISQRQVDFLSLLPLLFHANHPSLPGFVSRQCPAGISKYNPDNNSIRCARRLAKSFAYKHRAYLQYDIHALYLMGSTGTIAYSAKSDFDVWICHREDLSDIESNELKSKADKITKWCEEFNLEVNFFLINTELFRHGKIDKLSSESSGSTQHTLLLEEFYRTSLLLAGRYPIWWLVPPEFEYAYDEYVQHTIHQRLLDKHDFLNFGSISKVPSDEFYGATLWHIYKGIDSPYKSILKLLLMECYAKEHPHINLLSLDFKRAVYEKDKPDINQLDPYVMMMGKITRHLITENSTARLELARRCLYLKINDPLSKLMSNKNREINSTEATTDQKSAHDWRRNIMLEMITSWQWKQPKLLLMDERHKWKIDEVNKEHKDIIEALTYSYRKLSDFFRSRHKIARINKRDLHILGRKLYAAFEKKAGKIDIISHDQSIDLYEPQISLHPIFHSSHGITEQHRKKIKQHKEHGWFLYLGAIHHIGAAVSEPIKKSTHLVKLLCWCYFNRVISSHTSFILAQEVSTLNIAELKLIIQALEKVFPNATTGYASMDQLIKPAQLDLNLLILNIGIDPFLEKHSGGTQITSTQTDALNYGAMHENLLMTIDQVSLTSWHEVMYHHFNAESGLMECLCQYLKWNSSSDIAINAIEPRTPTLVCCYSSVRGEAISRRINQLFTDVINTFHQHGKRNWHDVSDSACRYLLTIEHGFYLIYQDETDVKYQKIVDPKELMRELAYPLSRFNSLVIDREFSGQKVLKLIFAENKENYIQLFYQNHKKTADIYIIDEYGSLYHHKASIEKNNIHISHFILFLDSIVKRILLNTGLDNFYQGSIETSFFDLDRINTHLDLNDSNFNTNNEQELNSDNEEAEIQLEIFEIEQLTSNKLILKEQFSKLENVPVHFFRIQVIADLDNHGSRCYTIYANNKEFNSFEYGQDLYKKVAEEVVNARKSKQTYGIYITDIDLSPTLIEIEGNQSIQISQLLKFKSEIEQRLNKAIRNLQNI